MAIRIRALNTFFVLLMGVVFTNCGPGRQTDFYDYSHISDLDRVPLIKPRDIVSADRGNTFTMPLWYSKLHDNQVTGFDSVGVKGSCMAIHFDSFYTGSEMSEAWIVADTLRRDERMFTDRRSYIAYLDSGTGSGLKLYEVKMLYKNFADKGVLPDEWPRHKKASWAK
ncbi:MAG: hypothetical protein JWO03_2950 [Bacteroidetes bacterium]|nr:hypothetical protein [Bacteroidota bacterium]